jgi:predicted hotdog family 3-hydroxylacyl-ACP dehydratase
MATTYPPIDDLVPHSPPMRVVEQLVDWERGRARCTMFIRQHNPFVESGRVATLATLEFLAQAVAACLGYEAFTQGGTVRVGMLVGVRQMEVLEPYLAVGDELVLDVQRLRGTDEISTFTGETRVGGRVVSRANMTLVHPEVPPTS